MTALRHLSGYVEKTADSQVNVRLPRGGLGLASAQLSSAQPYRLSLSTLRVPRIQPGAQHLDGLV